jgi:hypothetical protein
MHDDLTTKADLGNRRPLPKVIADFRREQHLQGFSLPAHLLKTAITCLTLLSGSLYLALRAGPADWMLVPLFFICANFIEWCFHRYPMHRPMPIPPGARFLYLNHTLIHHRAFLHDSMPVREYREFGLILMPWYTMLLVMTLGLPVGLLVWWLFGQGMFGIFYCVALLYYLVYETLHALYHVDDATQRHLGLKERRWFQFLRAHHAHHHRLDRMSRVNFNVTFPLADLCLKTREQPRLDADAGETATRWDSELNELERRELDASG